MRGVKPCLTVAGVQMSASPRAWELNTARAAGWMGAAVDAGARLVLLPELFAIGSFYAPDLPTFAEPSMGRTARWLLTVAQEHRIVVAGTILERCRSHMHNTLLVAEPDGRLLRYAKRHLGVEVEFAVAPGREPNVLRTSIGHVGCLICSDGNDAALRRNIARAGVDLVLVPQAIGATYQLGLMVESMEEAGCRPLWGEIVRELGAPAVTAGLVGGFENPRPQEIGDYLRGGTYVVDATGRGLAHVPFPEEGVAMATVRLGRERPMS
jgi:predicted amidohydrolase